MKRLLSLLLVLCSLLSLCVFAAASDETESGEDDQAVLARAVYPSMSPRPRQEDYVKENGWDLDNAYFEAEKAWRQDLGALRSQPKGYADGLQPWFRAGIRQFLSDAQGENRVFSPLNLTMALAMLSEVTDGDSRQQLLELLGAEDLEALRKTAASLWLQSYQDDGQTTSLLASSLWLRDDLDYEQSALDKLSSFYYASAFRGQMGSPAYDQLLQSWINEQTGGLLERQASGLHMDTDTVLALAATIFFKAPWVDSFGSYGTAPDLFHGPDGDQTVDYMHKSDVRSYYWGESFSAVALPLENGGAMWLVLPDEGLTPEALLQDDTVMDLLLPGGGADSVQRRSLIVNLKVPKFDVSSDLELSQGLKALGLTAVFDPAASDFSPLTRELAELYVSSVKHAARVKIDEQGCEAAAYTVILVAAGGAAPPDEEVDFTLDRPFLFVITNAGGLPLFAGIVNHPAE